MLQLPVELNYTAAVSKIKLYIDGAGIIKGVNAQEATTRARASVASNYPFAKLMEIAESVPTGRVRATSDKSDKI